MFRKCSCDFSQESRVSLSYKDLMCSFEAALQERAKQQGTDDSFPATMGINAFRGILDEFNKKKDNRELPEIKQKKEKKKKDKDLITVSGTVEWKNSSCVMENSGT